MMKNDIETACLSIENGYLNEAKKFFTELLAESSDDLIERIAKNRLIEINQRIKETKQCFSLSIESMTDENNFIICQIDMAYKEEHIEKLIKDLFKNSHKINYDKTSSVQLKYPASQKTQIIIEGFNKDQRCQWCKLFRKNIVYHIGKKNIIRDGHCPLGIDDL